MMSDEELLEASDWLLCGATVTSNGAYAAGVVSRANVSKLFAHISSLRSELEAAVRENEILQTQNRAWRDCVYVEGLPTRWLPDTEFGDPVGSIPRVTPKRLIELLDALAAEREACALAAIEWGESCATEDYAATQERNHAQAIAAAIRARGQE